MRRNPLFGFRWDSVIRLVCIALEQMANGGIGAYVYVKSRDLSGGILEFHPFSISGFPEGDRELLQVSKMEVAVAEQQSNADEMNKTARDDTCRASDEFTLHIKSAGAKSWTARLVEHVSLGTPLRHVTIEGPYGNPDICLSRYSTVLCVAGGIGFTPIAPFLEMAMDPEKRARYLPKLQRVCVLWSVQRASHAAWFAPILARCRSMELEVSVYVTRDTEDTQQAGPNLNVVTGRMNVMDEVEAAVFHDNRGDDTAQSRGLAVLACGPAALMDDTRRAGRVHNCHVHELLFHL
mmetsp:Transcript_17594/g.35331  ORF Transcript_17594/g.35331 Transcript_17594/m.35331 type:complete len:293 (+) Transcript_17594:904-1782(+)